jgi:hypothetical protein
VKKSSVSLGRSVNPATTNVDSLMKQAAAVAEKIVAPKGVEFASFEHRGRTYALSARLVVEVDLLENRVPPVVVRQK